ncbi:MAG: DNA translocase FtsK [Ignavibacteria bacterium]|nr:DNA translocase FtsK [Ignavibacteria bacterium]
MATEPENIVIKRGGSTIQPLGKNASSSDNSTNPQPTTSENKRIPRTSKSSQPPAKSPVENTRQIKIIAITMLLFSVLLLIALISYTSKDEANAELTFHDIMGIFRGDDAIRAKVDTTQNWLGLVGAVISNLLYNYTIGFSAITLPFVIGLWAKHLFVTQSIPPRVIKLTGTALILGTLLAGLMGTFQLVSWLPTFPGEWSGAVGQFIAAIFSDLIGKIGSFLVISVGILVTLVLGTGLDMDKLYLKLRLLYGKLQDYIAHGIEKYRAWRSSDKVENDTEQIDTTIPQPSTTTDLRDDEPARIVRRVAEQTSAKDLTTNSPIHQRELQIRRPEENISHNQPLEKSTHAINNDEETERAPFKPMTTHLDLPPQPSAIKQKADEVIDNQKVIVDVPEIQKTLTLTVEERLPSKDDIEIVPEVNVLDEEIVYTSPMLSLLTEQHVKEVTVDDAELKENARLLEEKLETFKISIENLTVTPGPVVTQYEFVPASGIKISQIENLSDDIALALKAKGIRIIAPIPGRGTVGIEIPNHNPSVVLFSSIIKSPKFHDNNNRLPLALGKTISGEVYCTDLAKMPHLLIAGSTGSGKSVGINTLIASLLYKMHPHDLKFVIIDPKKVEMALYGLLKKHFLAISPDVDETIITSPANAVLVLKSVVAEMERRYDVLASVGQRNVVDYNQKVAEGKYKETTNYVHRPLPYIVVVIDELADLMLTAGRDVEEPITRLAQLARAIGIHLIVATQRPSVNVITGIIKANFPARLAYQVASKIDSRTILDMGGADQLLGNGDMLFLPGGSPKPIRVQNSFISTDEVEAICTHIGNQVGYSMPYMLPSVSDKKQSGKGDVNGGDGRDVLFEEAANIVIQHQQGSVSLLQRRLKIGYSRAARVMDELEAAGIVGAFDGSKARAVLLESASELEAYL